MTRFHAWTTWANPKLHVFRDPTARTPAALAYDVPASGTDGQELTTFAPVLDFQVHEQVRFKLHEGGARESDVHNRLLERGEGYRFPDDVWFMQGVSRAVSLDPFARVIERVRVHVITARKYQNAKLHVWTPGGNSRDADASGHDLDGPYFDLQLTGLERHAFAFKCFVPNERWEPDSANRLWSSNDGAEIWVHSESPHVASRRPERSELRVHARVPSSWVTPHLHIWQEGSDYIEDITGTVNSDWVEYRTAVYSALPYRFTLFTRDGNRWEHREAIREISVDRDAEVWTIEGDHELFSSEPAADRTISLEIVARPPDCPIQESVVLDAWVNQGEIALASGLEPQPDGTFVFQTYPEVVTSFRFRSGPQTERLDRHFMKISTDTAPSTTTRRFVVLDRPDPLPQRPALPLFEDPPFSIERPGAFIRDGWLRFSVHAPSAASAEVVGDWTDWSSNPIGMKSTRDGAYFWAQVPVADVRAKLAPNDLHGARYKFRLNQIFLRQDPAADWVESSASEAASRFVDHAAFRWTDSTWQRPGWESLIIYQIHPRRFSSRFANQTPLGCVRAEIEEQAGYLRSLGCTGLLLMPINEFAGDFSWGYNPSFFYAVESSYGGPNALKALIDSCHSHGIAVYLDVVFNHAGDSDNILWSTARESFFDGNTDWGGMVNFDHDQVRYFFERNLAHFMEQYHVDGFRFDFTWVIRHGNEWTMGVKQPGSGGGWEFMHGLRRTVRAIDPRCLLMAEHLPNEWDLTRFGGPMDTQWCDNLHDRLEDACRGYEVMPALSEALALTHTSCNQWYEATNYPESHDEVGNEDDRLSHVARFGTGLRCNKVAAAAALLGRGIPMWFMGGEAGEARQFKIDENDALPLDAYSSDANAIRMRTWWRALCDLRHDNGSLSGPAALEVRHAVGRTLAFSRGDTRDYFVVLNFGDWSGWRLLSELGCPEGSYREVLNSTWPDFQVEWEDEHRVWSQVGPGASLHVPDYGAVILQRQ